MIRRHNGSEIQLKRFLLDKDYKWQVIRKRNEPLKILLVVDMQFDFVYGTLGTKEARARVRKVKKKIEECRKKGYIIIFTRDTHHENYLETAEGNKLPIIHCIENTLGWQIIPEIEVLENDIIVDKSTFGSIELATLLGNYEIESIEIIGLCTDICVISNAMILKAKFYEVPIIVDPSCCAGVTPESHENALNAMRMCQIDIFEQAA